MKSQNCKKLKDLDRDNEGFLKNPDSWTEETAELLAAEINIRLTEEHWCVIRFVREWHDTYQSVPELRKLLKHYRENGKAEEATRKHIYRLFPYGYGQQACKIAGMRKPLKLMLDI